jgi:hypothetical protein
LSGTNTLASLRTLVASQIDRNNITATSFISTSDLNSYINFENASLYGTITSSYQDWNVNQVQFTISNGNTIDLRLGIAPDFWILRQLQVANANPQPPWIKVPRLNSRDYQEYFGTATYPYTNQRAVAYNLWGSLLEITPISVATNTYNISYVPDVPQLVNDTDSIDGYWLSIGGWHECIVFGAASRAFLKEENYDGAQAMIQMRDKAMARVMAQCAPRDDGEAYRVVHKRRGRGGHNGW